MNDLLPATLVGHPPVRQNVYLRGGELVPWAGPTAEVRAPFDGPGDPNGGGAAAVVLGSYPRLDRSAALEVLSAARTAYDGGRGVWPTTPLSERLAAVAAFTDGMNARRREVVRLLASEIGKSVEDSAKEFDRTITYLNDTVEAAKELDRSCSRFETHSGVVAQIRRSPLGVALCMGPYNYPLNETFTTLVPAVLMGNCVILKPPRFGVLLYGPLLGVFAEAFPPGVVNTVYGEGPEVVGPLMESGGVDVLAFIGTSRVAGILKSSHPRPHRLRSVLGLDAKNPAVVLGDADLDTAVRECVLGTLSFNGQRCTALKVVHVHSSIHDRFVSRFAEAVDQLPAGPPWQRGVKITPLVEPGKPDYLDGLVGDAVSKGAVVATTRGGRVDRTLYRPVVLSSVTPAMRVYHEEQFGPVVPVLRFDDVAEPVGLVASSPYGQQVSLFGTDPAAVGPLIDHLVNQVCRVNLNSQCQRGPDVFPFTGRKDSAEGTLSVTDALRVFSIRTLVAANADGANKDLLRGIVRGRTSTFLSTDYVL